MIGDHIDINTTGKTLVLPTEDAAILPSFNQSVLNSDRLTIAESPFGGLKGSGSPDSYFSEFKLSNIPKVFDVFSNGSLAQFLKAYGAI